MRPEDETIGVDTPVVLPPAPKQYATRTEVEEGLNILSDADHAKLMIIAASHCRQRGLARNVCEPGDLLNQAVLKTLECEEGKRWNKALTMVRHLDRAMENISGHLVRERMKIVAFPDGLNPSETDVKSYQPPIDGGEETAKVSALLMAVFGADGQAQEVFVLRNTGFRPNEIQTRLKITDQEYETVNRRILRKISQFVTKTKN